MQLKSKFQIFKKMNMAAFKKSKWPPEKPISETVAEWNGQKIGITRERRFEPKFSKIIKNLRKIQNGHLSRKLSQLERNGCNFIYYSIVYVYIYYIRRFIIQWVHLFSLSKVLVECSLKIGSISAVMWPGCLGSGKTTSIP